MLERWNTHFSTTVDQELMGIDFQLAQDPNSSNLGTTNSRRGDFSRPKVRGKRALELGAGMGLAGMALALLGADVVFTDIGDVLPLLRRNVEQNVSPAALKLRDAGWAAAEVGHTSVASLDWSDRSCYADFQPPYEFILAADCVYSELAGEALTVHDEFMAQFGRHFTIRKVPTGKMDPNYQHPLIHIYLLKRRKEPLPEGEAAAAEAAAAEADDAQGAAAAAAQGAAEVAAAAGEQAAEDGTAAAGEPAEAAAAGSSAEDAEQHAGLQGADGEQSSSSQVGSDQADAEGASEQLQAGEGSGGSSEKAAVYQQQFQTRRQGAMLARLLKDVKIGGSNAS
ncbi:hypothetical protein COHA_008234 [Chlorella ohadii]|uniref:Uncharacterized protein n=1 Tax=Chlorella ohadii TaxID=2649997 RepID=A0AAD5DK76_9CHLO|nr:hypothetical protein COHA_008234 [Chlorella ohadii]